MVLQPTKTAMTLCDIDRDAGSKYLLQFSCQISVMGSGYPRTTSPFFNNHFADVSNFFFILAQLVQSETAVNFMSNEVCFARSMHSTSQVGKTSQV